MPKQSLFINGYGATPNLTDGNYTRYLTAINDWLNNHPDTDFDVYLCGGHTNRTDLTEAQSMANIWNHLGVPRNVSLILIESSTTARDNFKAVRQAGDLPLTVFCESSRRLTMRFFAKTLFTQTEVIGIAFDAASLKPIHRAKQLFLHLPLEVLAYHSPLIDLIRITLRQRHVARARQRSL